MSENKKRLMHHVSSVKDMFDVHGGQPKNGQKGRITYRDHGRAMSPKNRVVSARPVTVARLDGLWLLGFRRTDARLRIVDGILRILRGGVGGRHVFGIREKLEWEIRGIERVNL